MKEVFWCRGSVDGGCSQGEVGQDAGPGPAFVLDPSPVPVQLEQCKAALFVVAQIQVG